MEVASLGLRTSNFMWNQLAVIEWLMHMYSWAIILHLQFDGNRLSWTEDKKFYVKSAGYD